MKINTLELHRIQDQAAEQAVIPYRMALRDVLLAAEVMLLRHEQEIDDASNWKTLRDAVARGRRVTP